MRNKLLTLVLLFTLSLGVALTAHAADNRTFTLTDGKTDQTYVISLDGNYVSVSLNGEVLGSTYVANVAACSVYGDILTLYTVDNLNGVLGVFRFEFLSDYIDSEAINAYAFYNQNCFTADKNGSVYYVADYDTSKLCVYKDGYSEEISLKEPIKQLLCIDGENIIIVTTKSTYIYGYEKLTKALTYPLFVPAHYAGGGMIKDTNGKEYVYENNSLSEKGISTAAATTVQATNIEDNFYYAEVGTTVSGIKKAFADFEITKIAKADGTVIQSGKVGTGTTITFSTGKSITVIIFGELTGEGNINSRDLKAILNHLSEKELLEGFFLTAADVNSDGKVTTKDALLIAGTF